jgi:hypothetical protein
VLVGEQQTVNPDQIGMAQKGDIIAPQKPFASLALV